MKILKLIVAFGVGSMLAALMLWISLTVGANDLQRFLVLAWAGLSVLGLGGCAWDLLWLRVQIVFVPLLLLGVGVLSFFYRV